MALFGKSMMPNHEQKQCVNMAAIIDTCLRLWFGVGVASRSLSA